MIGTESEAGDFASAANSCPYSFPFQGRWKELQVFDLYSGSRSLTLRVEQNRVVLDSESQATCVRLGRAIQLLRGAGVPGARGKVQQANFLNRDTGRGCRSCLPSKGWKRWETQVWQRL